MSGKIMLNALLRQAGIIERFRPSSRTPTLLGLQLEIEQIDATYLSSTSAERLAHYNQILREQLTRLEAELESIVEPYRELMGLWSGRALTVAKIDRKLTMDITQLREALRQLTQDLVVFRDPVQLADGP